MLAVGGNIVPKGPVSARTTEAPTPMSSHSITKQNLRNLFTFIAYLYIG